MTSEKAPGPALAGARRAAILDVGAYVPRLRLDRARIGDAWGMAMGTGEKAVANWDEDSITMGIEAGLDCLGKRDTSVVDLCVLATTTPPYLEKQSATVIATALDLARGARTVDVTGTLRAGTTAIQVGMDAVAAGSARQALVTVADNRLARPQSLLENSFGDAAAAFLLAPAGTVDAIAEIEFSLSVYNETVEFWRDPGDRFVREWEDRFIRQAGYLPVMSEAITAALVEAELKPGDFAGVVVYPLDPKSARNLVRGLGFEEGTLADDLGSSVGACGAAQVPLELVSVLERAAPGERILVAGYGDGADVMVLRVTDAIERWKPRRGVAGHIASSRQVANYAAYIGTKQLMETEAGSRKLEYASPPQMWRDRASVLGRYGQRCRGCSTVQFPFQRVCVVCSRKDDFDEVRVAPRGRLFTFTIDILMPSPAPPTIMAIVDLEDGARMFIPVTDIGVEEAKIGMPLELCVRKLHDAQGIHHYYWKARPSRDEPAKEEQ